MWISRDADGLLKLFNDKPFKDHQQSSWVSDTWSPMAIDDDCCPCASVTFENSPVEVFVYDQEQLDSLCHAEYSRGWDDGELRGFTDGLEYQNGDEKGHVMLSLTKDEVGSLMSIVGANASLEPEQRKVQQYVLDELDKLWKQL